MANRQCQECSFRVSDGTELFYRVWAPTSPSHKAVILFHRGHEHSGRWQDFVDRIALEDFWFFAWDARGHGRSPGERGYAESFGQLVKEADEFVRHVTSRNCIPMENLAVVGQSVGAVLGATWAHDYAPPIRVQVLANPALRIKLYVPFAIAGLRMLNKLKRPAFIKSYVKSSLLTHDAQQARAYDEDKLVSRQIAVNILLDLFDTSTRLINDAGAINVPTLLLMSGSDWVVRNQPQEQLLNNMSSSVRESELYPGFFHSTFWEKDRDQPIARTRQFIMDAYAQGTGKVSLSDADETGYAKDVYDRLQKPLPALSFKRWMYAGQSLLMQTGGRLSKGIRIGWRTGFDSGQSLDHVYRNTPEGTTFIGRLVDRFYLKSPGWRGIRTRKVHLESLLDQAIAELTARREPIQLLDIAAGPGRYVLDAIRNHPEAKISAVLCDRDESGLAAGQRLAESLQVKNVTYRKNDAFDAQAVAAITPRPNVVIVSGLYELFPSNKLVAQSLTGVSRTIVDNGFLIYTNQPWHPQQEMIARVLPNRDGDPWVMRCRTQAEMDQLVAAAGFTKVSMLIDDDGIFSVSLAVKNDTAKCR